MSSRRCRVHDCMEAGGRAMQGAIAETHSVYDIHEELSTAATRKSRKKTINRGALYSTSALS